MSELEDRIRAHGLELQIWFPATRYLTAAKLCRKLRRLEMQLNDLYTRACDRELTEEEQHATSEAEEEVKRVLWGAEAYEIGYAPKDLPILHINSDPRGYALKISDGWMRENRDCALAKDWGGYGLLAPDLREDR